MDVDTRYIPKYAVGQRVWRIINAERGEWGTAIVHYVRLDVYREEARASRRENREWNPEINRQYTYHAEIPNFYSDSFTSEDTNVYDNEEAVIAATAVAKAEWDAQRRETAEREIENYERRAENLRRFLRGEEPLEDVGPSDSDDAAPLRYGRLTRSDYPVPEMTATDSAG